VIRLILRILVFFVITLAEIIDAGDHVAVKTRQRGRGKGSGVQVEAEIWFVTRFRNGKIVDWRMFGAEADARAASGLSE
jgi:ketosteroid isomerase-like protein